MIDIIKIEGNDVIQKQELKLKEQVTIIYGLNNSGKTQILKCVNDSLNTLYYKNMFNTDDFLKYTYIPTNRVNKSDLKLKSIYTTRDNESFLNFTKEKEQEYGEHIATLRKEYSNVKVINTFINEILKRLFDFNGNYELNSAKIYSDGIENIISIFLDIICVTIWDKNVETFTLAELKDLFAEKELIIAIDEIEMYLHVSVQEKVIQCITEIFSKSKIILTTHSPLIITRVKNIQLLEITDGILNERDKVYYYKDLDEIYELLFDIEMLPEEFKQDYNYLCDLIAKDDEYDQNKIKNIKLKIEEQENIHIKKYLNKFLIKVETIYSEN